MRSAAPVRPDAYGEPGGDHVGPPGRRLGPGACQSDLSPGQRQLGSRAAAEPRPALSGRALRAGSKAFFFEKKKQKTFIQFGKEPDE